MTLPQHRLIALLYIALLALAGCTPVQPAPRTVPPRTVSQTVPPPVEAASPPAVALETELIEDVVEIADGALPLEGEWRFSLVPQFTPDMAAPAFDDSAWAAVQAPRRWNEQGLADQTASGAVVVYRRTVDFPAEWGQAPLGISAWFNPYGAQVFVNGQKVEPLRLPFAPYADISALAAPGAPNTVAVVVQYDGALDYAGSAPPRIGPIGTRPVTRIEETDGAFATPQGDAAYTIVYPLADDPLPALVLVASGSHGLAEQTAWLDTARDLARSGYAAMAVALPAQTAEGVAAAVEILAALPQVNPDQLFLWGVDEAATDVLTAAATLPVRGAIALAPPMWTKLPPVGDTPLLLMATEQYRGGLILNQLRSLAAPLAEQAQVVALPGDGHGTFVLTNAWNDLRSAVLAWLAARLTG